MAYSLKYTSNFYNFYGKLVEVEISKQNYVGSITALRNTEVFIEVNFQDNNTPVIGTGCSIVVVNQGEFTDLEDLLTTMEKQFKCVIKYAGTTVFQGFSICDLNEQQFNRLSRIKLQFTDYLRRLEGHFAENFFVGSNTDLLTLVQELYVTAGFGAAYEFYVNSTLFETRQNNGNTDTFLKQTYVENNIFFSDPNTYDDIYTSINRTLKPFGCFIYSAGDKWILERQEDIARGGGGMTPWVKYDLYQNASSVAGLMEVYDKQTGDFQYVDESQILEYASGLRTLILNLKDKQYDTFVFNDYNVNMQRTNQTLPDPGTLQGKTWYAYQDVSLLQVGYDYRGIGSYIKWGYADGITDYALKGLYYAFNVQLPLNAEEPVMLNVDFKMGGELDMIGANKVIINFILRIDGGPYSGYFLSKIAVPPNDTIIDALGSSFIPAVFNTTEIDVSTSAEKVWSVSKSFNLSDSYSEDGYTFRSIQDLLGNPATQKFMIYFFPSIITFDLGGLVAPFLYSRVNYLGDVQITINQQKIVNKITYNINEDFIKTEEIDIDLWDLNNINFANGLMYGLGGVGNDAIGKTALWTSEKSPVAEELMDIFCKNKFRNYARTIHKLKARILHDGYMKPFSVLTDSQRAGVNFILQGYTWDLFNGIYDIVAEEYTDEDISIAEEGDSGGASSGGGGGDPGITPPAPTNLAAAQGSPGLFIGITWDDALGATGYMLQRKPYYNGTSWIDNWQTIFEGPPGVLFNAAYDSIQLEGILADGQVISYRIASKTAQVYGVFSATVTVIWAN